MGAMKNVIIGISVSTAVAFLLIAVITTIQIFAVVVGGDNTIRGELWLLMIISFTGGIIMLGLAWGVAEVTETRRAQREGLLPARSGPADDEDEF